MASRSLGAFHALYEDPLALFVSAISAGVSFRIAILRTPPLVSQVAKPSGLLACDSIRVSSSRPSVLRLTTTLSSTQQRTTSSMTRMRNLYQVLFWYLTYVPVSFSEASAPSRLD